MRFQHGLLNQFKQAMIPGIPSRFRDSRNIPGIPTRFRNSEKILGIPTEFRSDSRIPGIPKIFQDSEKIPGIPTRFRKDSGQCTRFHYKVVYPQGLGLASDVVSQFCLASYMSQGSCDEHHLASCVVRFSCRIMEAGVTRQFFGVVGLSFNLHPLRV